MFRTLMVASILVGTGSIAEAQDETAPQCPTSVVQATEDLRNRIVSYSRHGRDGMMCATIAVFPLEEQVMECLRGTDQGDSCLRVQTFLTLREEGFYRAAFELNTDLQRQETSEQ